MTGMRVMVVFVLFDLPTGSKVEKRRYIEFRKFLVGEGYHMEQFSVYTRHVLGRDAADAQIARLARNAPGTGSVIAFTMTEKEYSRRRQIVGQQRLGVRASEETAGQMTILF